MTWSTVGMLTWSRSSPTPEEKARVWPLVVSVWPAYDTYVSRTDRDIRVFLLRPTSS